MSRRRSGAPTVPPLPRLVPDLPRGNLADSGAGEGRWGPLGGFLRADAGERFSHEAVLYGGVSRILPPLVRSWAGPLARLVEGIAARRRRPLPAAGSRQLPTIAVHGLALGGAGKTPLVAWLSRRLTRAGAGPVAVGTRERSRVGDETALLERLLPGCAILAACRPAEAAARAAALGCRALVLDDPSLSRPAAAHLRVVCLRPGDDWAMPVFPAGERRPGCVQAWEVDHLVLFDGAEPPAGLGLPVTRARVVPEGLVELEAWARSAAAAPFVRAAGRRLFVVCAVARPERVARSVADLGAIVVGHRALRDHAAIPTALRGRIESHAAAAGAEAVVITEKDAARILAGSSRVPPPRLPWLVVRTRLELEDDGRALLDDFARRSGLAGSGLAGRPEPPGRDGGDGAESTPLASGSPCGDDDFAAC